MLVYVTAHATDHPQVSWVSEYPHNPYTDYSSYGTLPHVSLLGSYSLSVLSDTSLDKIWSATRTLGTTTLYPQIGDDLLGIHWSREVDTETDVVLSLSNDNLSSSWTRLNDTDIAPRRQL
jgi:hypothetical protein